MKPCGPANKGFTLVELMITMAIAAMAATAGYHALRAGLIHDRGLRDQAAQKADIDIAASILGKDLRCAYLAGDEPDTAFAGRTESAETGDRLDFVRLDGADTMSEEKRAISYTFEKNKEAGTWNLWRWPHAAIGGDSSAAERTLLCENVRSFKLRYFDGQEWHDSWGWDAGAQRRTQGIRGLPVVVRLDLSTIDQERTFLFPVMTSLLNESL